MELFPSLVLRDGEEGLLLHRLLRVGALPHPDHGRDELLEEAWDLKQGGYWTCSQLMKQALDVATVMILIGHDHQMTVAETLGVLVDCLVLQA